LKYSIWEILTFNVSNGIILDMRRCSKCRTNKSPEEFYSDRGWCKECHKEYNRVTASRRAEAAKKWRERQKISEADETAVCNKCGWRKSLADFYFRNDRGYRKECKFCFDKKISAITERRCSLCKETLPISEFIYDAERQKYRPRCKVCMSIDRKEHYLLNRDTVIQRNRISRYRSYGLTEEEISSLSDKTKCEACGEKENLVVDHCHERKIFRGVLCHRCNITLGYSLDSAERLLALANYLTRPRER
jgi:hypothetical protein